MAASKWSRLLFIRWINVDLTHAAKADNVRLSIAAAMLGPQIHGRTL